MSGSGEQERVIRYRFEFTGGGTREFLVRLDPATLGILPDGRASWPEWTRLEYRRCASCTLDPATTPRCPIAANLAGIIEAFRDSVSHEEVLVRVETERRTYEKQTSLQRGLASLMGIYMVTSGCPVMDRLRPLVDTHLPFATLEESMYRYITSYLLEQYFVAKDGGEPDWEYRGFLLLLEEIRQVDIDFSHRLRDLKIKDASLNALIILNLFGEMAAMAVTGEEMERLERLYLAAVGRRTRGSDPASF